MSSFLSRSCGLVVRQPLGGASRSHQATYRGRKCPTGAGFLAWRGTHPVEAPAFLHGVLHSRAGVHCTVRKETIRRGGAYWYVYRSVQRRAVKHYISRTDDLSILRLEEVAERCMMHHLLI